MFECIQRCLSFRKDISMFLKVVFESVCGVGFEKWASVFCKFDQVTKSCLPLNLLKGFFYVFNPFNNFVPPLYLMDNLVLGC